MVCTRTVEQKHSKHNNTNCERNYYYKKKLFTFELSIMSEGGYFPWKRQTITGGKPGDYSSLSKPLPNLPKGMTWLRDPKTREWSIVDNNNTNSNTNKDGLDEKKDKSVTSSDIDVPDNCDYLVHTVQPTDTFQGICLQYGISSVALRQVNKFSGSNLVLAPKTLVIPLSRKDYKVKLNQRAEGKEEDGIETKIHHFLVTFRNNQASTLVGRKEAIAYLDMNDGNLELAINDAKEDFGWEVGNNNN